MKRIRNAAVLAAILAFSGATQARVPPTPRNLVRLEDALTSEVELKTPKAVDRDEQYGSSRDYTQESALNQRQRKRRRQYARAGKEKARDPVTD